MPKLQLKTQNFLILSVLFCLPFYFIKFKYGWLSLNLVEILILILLALWLINRNTRYPPDSLRDSKRAGQIPNTKYILPVFLIIAGIVSSVIINKNYYIGFGIIKGWFVFPMIFAVILHDCLAKNEKLLNKIFIILFASGILVAIEGAYYWLFGLMTYDGRLRIFFDSPNQLAMYLAPVFLIGIIKFGFEESPDGKSGEGKAELWKKISAVMGITVITFNLYLAKSYGAWLAIGVALVVVFWLKYREKWSKKYYIITIITIIILITLTGFGKLENIKNLGDRSSLASREMIWESAILMIKNNPVLGIGPGNFQNTYLEYQKYFPPYLEWAVPQPHNLYLAFWLESGLLGLVGFVWLLILFFHDNKKARQGRGLLEEARENNFGTGLLCLAITLYFLVHGLIDTTYWRNDMAILFWVVIAINLFLAREETKNQISKTKNTDQNFKIFSF